MDALSEAQIQAIVSCRRQGIAYKKIARSRALSSSSVHKYAKSVELSEEKKIQLKQNELKNWANFASVFAAEKEIKIPVLDMDFANLLGHLFFDGSVFRRSNGGFILSYTNASKKAIRAFLEKMSCCFALVDYTTMVKVRKTEYFEVQFNSKKAYFFLQQIAPTFSTSRGAHVPDLIKSASLEIKAAFLRAFWDDEGCISNNGALTGYSKSEQMITDLVLLLHDLGINSTMRSYVRKNSFISIIRIVSIKANFEQFIAKVGFEHALVTRGYNKGQYKKDVLARKFAEKWGV